MTGAKGGRRGSAWVAVYCTGVIAFAATSSASPEAHRLHASVDTAAASLPRAGAAPANQMLGEDKQEMTKRSNVAVPDCYRGTPARATQSPDGTLVITLGSGSRGLVFAPISWEDACAWKAQALLFAQRGYRVASLSWGPHRSRSIREAAQILDEAGASAVVLVGACVGGTAALDQALPLSPLVRGVVAVSPLVSVAGISVGPTFPDYKGPVLLIGTTRDPLTPPAALKQIDQMRPIRSDLMMFEGDEHGVEIFKHEQHGPKAQQALDAFLNRTFS